MNEKEYQLNLLKKQNKILLICIIIGIITMIVQIILILKKLGVI